jgi:shikimate dehydrogenase
MARTFLSELVGSFSTPAADNPTVAMVEAAFAAMGLDWRYVNCEVAPEALGDAVRGARAMGWRGFNCSLPHKVAVIDHLDGLAPSAEIMGAVNCVVRRGDRLIGENTDGQGFLASLRAVVEPAGQAAVVLGAGGAARAIAVELALAGASEITIVNRSPERGEALAALVAARTPASVRFVAWSGPFAAPRSAGVLVNATSIGLPPDVGAMPDVDPASLRPGLVVADVIPNPPRTPLIREAEARGCVTLDGMGMLINQGVIGVRLWTGAEPDAAVMRKTLERIFAG